MKTPFQLLAETLFPNLNTTIQDLELQYPARTLKTGAEVVRFAPSPTGFLHTGSLFTALVARTLASQTEGVFFLRLEDTDKQREVIGSDVTLLEQMKTFDVYPDEGFLGTQEKGPYGPYRQSDRASIYQTVIKAMIEKGDAYPCFATQEELETLRKEQEKQKALPGYYGQYAQYRNFDPIEAIALIKQGKPWVIRFKSEGQLTRMIDIHDLIRGDLKLSENVLDIVILKRDGLPTYHFAHVVDDHLMRTTLVSRGEEWLSSLPVHLQMFERLRWTPPRFAHLPVINKLDNGAKRKLSKRKDPEASVSYFLEEGYPIEALKEYLMTIANSNFEEWRMLHPDAPRNQFEFHIEKMTLDGALFDLQKIAFISKELIAKKTASQLLEEARIYAKTYDVKLAHFIHNQPAYVEAILNIERQKAKPRKDYAKYKDIYPLIAFFEDQAFDELQEKALILLTRFSKPLLSESVTLLEKAFPNQIDETAWFQDFKLLGQQLGLASSAKEMKLNPTLYQGHIGDLAEILRVVLTGQTQSPSLFEVMKVLGFDRFLKRIHFMRALLKRRS
jgi:glutamyl-tRNA synthetase